MWRNYKIKTWHFVVILIILILLTNIVGIIEWVNPPSDEERTWLHELDSESFNDSISTGTCFVMFFSDEEGYSNRMEYNLSCANYNESESIRHFKINVDKNPVDFSRHYISGTPTTIIFRDGKPIDIIIGIVSASNIERIYKKIKKQS